jgi:hypothetical protein
MQLRDAMRILIPTCQIVGTFILPLLRVCLIDHVGCVVLGGVVGIVVAFRSKHFGPRKARRPNRNSL